MVSSPNKFSLILNLTSDLQRKDSQKREGSCHQERKTGTLVAFQRIEQRKLKSESSVGFRGLVEVRFLPFCSVSSSARCSRSLEFPQTTSVLARCLFWVICIDQTCPVNPLESLFIGVSCCSGWSLLCSSSPCLCPEHVPNFSNSSCFSGMFST